MEFELKFLVDEPAVDRLRVDVLKGAQAQPVHSLYFDTKDRDLRMAGLSLRVREAGGRRVQTLKGLNGVERFERETPLETLEPDLSRLADTPAIDVLDDAPVLALFETRVRRAVHTLEDGEGRIELALDDGELVAGARKTPIRELELELKSGPPARLFDIAERLRAEHGLTLCMASKASRGYALADGGSPAQRQTPGLSSKTSARDAFRTLAHADLAAFEASVRLVRSGDSLEAVHQARVALRRLRVVVRAFRPTVDDDRRPKVEQSLRQWAGRFGEARDLDVFVSETFRPLARHEAGAAAFGRKLLSAQAAARETVRRGMAEGEADAFLLSTLAWVMAGRWSDASHTRHEGERSLGDLAPALLSKAWKGFRERGRELDWSDAEARHRLRIQAKKLRYLGDALETVAPRPKPFDKTLRRFQDAAGRLNDLHVGPALARRVLGDGAPEDAVFAAGEIVGAARAGERHLIHRARKAYATLISRGPYWR